MTTDPEDWPVQTPPEPDPAWPPVAVPGGPRDPDGSPVLFSPETLAEIAAANRDRPDHAPEGDGSRDRPVWRRSGDDLIQRPGPRHG